MMGTYTPNSWDAPCRRCGAGTGEPCMPLTDAHGHATVLRTHRERGWRPWEFAEQGYIQYTMRDEDGFLYHLARKPTQRPVEHAGWTTETDAP